MRHVPTTKALTLSLAVTLPLMLLVQCVGDEVGSDKENGQQDASGGTDGTSNATDSSSSQSDSQPGPSDASDSGSDAPTGLACDLLKPFGTPSLLLQVNSPDFDEIARISPAGDELFLSRYASGQPRKIFRFTRTLPNGLWGNAMEQPPLNLAPDNSTVTTTTGLTFTQDGLTAFFQYYDVPGSPTSHVYASTRPSIGGTWTKPQAVNGLGIGETPWLSENGQRIYFFNNTLGNFHIFKADRDVNGFANVTAIGLSTAEDRYPVLSVDEKTIYFAAFAPTPDAGPATMNVYKATRQTLTDNFGTATFVEELNFKGQFTAPTWLSKDGCTILLTGTRADGAKMDIIQAVKPL